MNKHRNVADKLGWEPRRKYATTRFSIGFCSLETGSSCADIQCSFDGCDNATNDAYGTLLTLVS